MKMKFFKKLKFLEMGGVCLFRSFASMLYQPLLLCNRYSSGAPVDPRLFEKEKQLADLIGQSTVDLLQANLLFSIRWFCLGSYL